ncbi:p150-Glued [Schizosaccharomyces octosporus yFS286]|uniref:P150-Glued n=1 Tax=Schizosaccharomyces octosporus (strain yFS286) TaxID=483514 RepID=S9RG81_SCHOY|nr:p150-Glued [Schizosaccharomyces octosporus yFS286]EPX73074.1 p150-Glued [Schizosaccharomyces octosporus yFS286]
MSYVSVGDLVLVHEEPGIVRFTGSTKFASGIWLGVEMIDKIGRHDGSVQGKRYFTCEEGKGLFIRACSSSVRKKTGKTRVISDGKKAKSLEKGTPTKSSHNAKESRFIKSSLQGKDVKKQPFPSLTVSTPTKTDGSNISTPFLDLTDDSETTLISIGSDSLDNTPINENFESDKSASIDFPNYHKSTPHLLREKSTITESNIKFQLKLEIETLRKELNEADNSLHYYKASYNKANEQIKERDIKLEELHREQEMNSAWKKIRPKLQKKMLSMQEEIEKLKQQLKSFKIQSQGIATVSNDSESTNAYELLKEKLITEKPTDTSAKCENGEQIQTNEDYICLIEELRKENIELKTQLEDLQLLKELSDEIERDQFEKITSLEKENQQKGDLLAMLENAFSQEVENLRGQKQLTGLANRERFCSSESETSETIGLALGDVHNLVDAIRECYGIAFNNLQKFYLDEESSDILEVSFKISYIQNISLCLSESMYGKINRTEGSCRQVLPGFIEQWYYTISVAQWSEWLIGFTCENGVKALLSDALLKDTIISIFCLLDVYAKNPGESTLENLQKSWKQVDNWVKTRTDADHLDPYNEYNRCKELLDSILIVDMFISKADLCQNDDVNRVPTEMTEIGDMSEDIRLFLRQKNKARKVFFPKEKIISMDFSSLAEELFLKPQCQESDTQYTSSQIIDNWLKNFQEIKRSFREFQFCMSEKDEAVFVATDLHCFWDIVMKSMPSMEYVKENASLKLVCSEKNELINHLKIQIERLDKQVLQKEDLKEKIHQYELVEKELREELSRAKSDEKDAHDVDVLMKMELEKKQLKDMFKQNELVIHVKFQEIVRKLKQDLNEARKEILNVNLNQEEDYEWLFMPLSHEKFVARDDYARIPQQLNAFASQMKPISLNRYSQSKGK